MLFVVVVLGTMVVCSVELLRQFFTGALCERDEVAS